MDAKIKSEIISGKWNLPAFDSEMKILMGEATPEFCMIVKIEAQEEELRNCATDKEKAYKLLEILAA